MQVMLRDNTFTQDTFLIIIWSISYTVNSIDSLMLCHYTLYNIISYVIITYVRSCTINLSEMYILHKPDIQHHLERAFFFPVLFHKTVKKKARRFTRYKTLHYIYIYIYISIHDSVCLACHYSEIIVEDNNLRIVTTCCWGLSTMYYMSCAYPIHTQYD